MLPSWMVTYSAPAMAGPAIAGRAVKTDQELRTTIAANKPGTVVELEVAHQDGRHANLKVKLGELPENTRTPVSRHFTTP